MKKRLELLAKSRLDSKIFRESNKRTQRYLIQSLSRFNAIAPVSEYNEETLLEEYEEIIVRGIKILYLEDTVAQELMKKEESGQAAVLLTLLGHMEQVYLQEVQLIKDEG